MNTIKSINAIAMAFSHLNRRGIHSCALSDLGDSDLPTEE
jgi:hypothetical protein